jgi:hypothetical protein
MEQISYAIYHGLLLALHANITVRWIVLPESNYLVYLENSQVTKKIFGKHCSRGPIQDTSFSL